jgi:outer membrane protein insertion porin family
MAAQIKVCSPFRVLRTRSLWIVGCVLSLTSALLPASASPRGLADVSARSSSAPDSSDSASPADDKSQESSSKQQESSSKPPEQESSSKQQAQQPDQSQQQQPAPSQAAPQPTQSPLEAAPTQAAPTADQNSPAIVDRIIFIGNRRIRSDTLKARIFSREGDPYNEETLRRDFQALWNTQFFEDVKLRVEDSPDGPNHKNIIFEVRERPVIRRIRYDGIHSISESDILDRFKERKVGLTVESSFDPTRIKKAEVVLKELLGEHGRQFATVTPQYERIASSNAVILVFKIQEGPKVKVGHIKFTGNHAFSDRKLLRQMRHDRPYSIPLYFWDIAVLSKTYDSEKLTEDLEVGVRGYYQDNGYFKVVVAPNGPILENYDTEGYKLGVPLTGRTHGKAVNITIPIEEGQRYKMGTLKIVSADPDKALSLKVEALKTVFPLKQGDIFSAAKVRKAIEDYGKAYGQYGFIDFTAEPEFDIDDPSATINLTLRFSE